MTVWTCPIHFLTFAIPEHYAGVVCIKCATQTSPVGSPAPSPTASTETPTGASTRSTVGAGRQDSSGRVSAKGGARPSRPTPDPERVKAIEGAEITQEDADAVQGWMKRVFYAKRDTEHSLAKADFFKLVDACGAFGFEGPWKEARDWIRGLVEAKSDAATAKVAKVLALAGQITLKNSVSVNKVQHTEAERETLAFFENHKANEDGHTLSDVQAEVAMASQALLDRLADGAQIYEIRPGKYRRLV